MTASIPSPEQVRIAIRINNHMQELARAGVAGDMAIFAEMAPHLTEFKSIMDAASQDVMDELCRRYDGFQRYTVVLTSVALRIVRCPDYGHPPYH